MRSLETFQIDELSAVDHPAQVHARMTLMKRADVPTENDEMPKYAATPAEAAGYDEFEQAVQRIASERGLSKLAAMTIARQLHSDLFAKTRYDQRTGEDPTAKARADGRARQARIDDAINKAMSNGRVDRLEALREVRRRQPALFAD